MAEFNAWIHAMHTQLEASVTKMEAQPQGSYTAPMSKGYSWSSEDDTESESEQNSFEFFEMRRKLPHTKTRKFLADSPSARATPVSIPARTHDFGWCDRDDVREARAACPCGNDCDDFFGGDAEWSSSQCRAQSEDKEDAHDEFIFDMEM